MAMEVSSRCLQTFKVATFNFKKDSTAASLKEAALLKLLGISG